MAVVTASALIFRFRTQHLTLASPNRDNATVKYQSKQEGKLGGFYTAWCTSVTPVYIASDGSSSGSVSPED